MINNAKILAIIPARSGSKRLPHKNLKKLGGKPLVQWTIEAAQGSKYIDQIHVTTDCDDVFNIAQLLNIDVKAKRPDHLATDTATTRDVVLNVLEMSDYADFHYFILLQPTSPFRTSRDIDNAIEELMIKEADAIVSVCQASHPPQWMNTLRDDLDMTNFISSENQKRSQDLEKYYMLNGAIYLIKINKFLEEKSFLLKSNSFAYIMSSESSIDIDTEFDFKIAEAML